MKLRLLLIAALALGTLAFLAPQASSLDLVYDLKAAKDKSGPYRQVTKMNVKNSPEDSFWRLKNNAEITRHFSFESEKNFDGYKAAWSRGNNDITNDVDTGYTFNVKAHDSVTLKAVVKKGNDPAPQSCLVGQVQDTDEFTTDEAHLGINDDCPS